MTRQLVIRYTTKVNPIDQQILRIQSDAESTFKNPTCDMTFIENLGALVRLDLGGNALVEIDLYRIRNLTSIRHLDLSENYLKEIDLSPLEQFEELETLDISYNKLETIDLAPLSNCKNLRYVYLHSNCLKIVNIAPIVHLEHLKSVVIGKPNDNKPIPLYSSSLYYNPPILLDPVYALFCDTSVPYWLRCHKSIEQIQFTPTFYRELVTDFGWVTLRTHLIALQKRIRSTIDFRAQKILLENLGLPELACYDGSIKDIVEFLPSEGTFEEGVEHIRSCMISLLHQQLENGGSTLFFDIEKLATTPASVLIPLIVSKRANELKNIILYDYNGSVNLMPLWLTGFGFKVLHAIGCGKKEHSYYLTSKIDDSFTKLGVGIKLKKTNSRKKYESLGQTPSKPLLDYVLSFVH